MAAAAAAAADAAAEATAATAVAAATEAAAATKGAGATEGAATACHVMLYCSLEEARIVLFQVLRSFLRLHT